MISETNIRVRYQETDQMKVVYYGNYFTWFEVGRNEHFRELEFPYSYLEENGIYIPVVRANCEYKKPALYDDLLTLTTKITKLTPARIVFGYRITKKENGQDKLLTIGETVHAFVSEQGIPISLKNYWPKLYEGIIQYVRAEE